MHARCPNQGEKEHSIKSHVSRQLGPANPGDENTKGPTTSNRQGPHGPTFRADGQARAAFPRRRRRRWRRRPRFLAQTPRRERVGERGRHPSRICHDS
ncbi:hypothetical protein BT93_I1008 [Corymbia citriodora subsp. variegata]|nr:hypothetical protein BT93_I1008 [Corymbia citriodora subsp. variegata]KAF8013015.1 hypothetical protein BT93_I1008 [Corymbia citriodora subsp. variegata]